MSKTYTVVVHQDHESGFWAEVPALPGCYSQGETVDELMANIREAIAGVLDNAGRGKRARSEYSAQRIGHLKPITGPEICWPLEASGCRRHWNSIPSTLSRSGVYLLSFLLFLLHVEAQPRLDLLISLHGNGDDHVAAMAVDTRGNIYLTGTSTSTDLGTPGTIQPRRASSSLYSFDVAAGKVSPLFPPSRTRVGSLAPDPQHPGTVYISTQDGLMKTTDNGRTWTVLSDGLPAGDAPYVIVVAPSASNVLYAGFPSGIFKSTDAGETWRQTAPVPNAPDSGYFTTTTGIAVDPADPSHVFAYGSQTYSTNDGGSSWTALGGHFLNITFDASQPGTIYAYEFSGSSPTLVKSTDNGKTFPGLSGQPSFNFIRSIFPDPKRPGTAYVSGFGIAGVSGIFRSGDAGATWTQRTDFVASQILQDPATGALYASTDQGGIVRSDDGFQTFTSITASIPANLMAIAQSGTLFIATDSKREMFVSKLDSDGRLLFSTYVGGIAGSAGTAIAVDASGGIYVAGSSQSADFPATASIQPGPSQPSSSSRSSLYLLKLSSDGTRLEYSTQIPADSATANALAIDAAGNLYLTGTTGRGYPTTPNSAQPEFQPPPPYIAGGGPVHIDAFATKIAADGKTLIYSTYFGNGGVDRASAIVVDPDGNAYIAGTRLWKLNSSGTAVLWSTSFAQGEFRAATLDKAGNLYLCGGTLFTGLYTSANAFQKVAPSYHGTIIDRRFMAGDADAFVMKFSPGGDVLYSTLLGGRYQEAATAITVDEQGNAIVVGYTGSMDFPVRYPFQAPFNKSTGFLAKFNADGSDLLYSTYLGDSRPFGAVALARNPLGGVILAGSTTVGNSEVFLNKIGEVNAPPAIHLDSVLNTANLFGGSVSPGEWITLRGGFGPNSRVLVGEQPIPVTSVSDTEIRARVPDTFQPAGATTMRVDSANGSSPSIFVNTAAATPAIFTQDGTGFGQALAFNADGKLNSPANPAAKGAEIAIVANGLGVPGPDRSIAVFFAGAITVPAVVRNAKVEGLPGDSYSLVVATIPAAVVGGLGAGIWLVVNGISFGPPPVTISVQ